MIKEDTDFVFEEVMVWVGFPYNGEGPPRLVIECTQPTGGEYDRYTWGCLYTVRRVVNGKMLS